MASTSAKQTKSTKRKAPSTAWKKGESGNPNGRPPKELAIADILRDMGNAKDGDRTKREVMLAKVYEKALEGDKWATEFIADRTEGKPVQHRIQENIDREPVEVIEVD